MGSQALHIQQWRPLTLWLQENNRHPGTWTDGRTDDGRRVAEEGRASCLPSLTLFSTGTSSPGAHLVELGQLSIGCILLGCVLGTCRQGWLGAQHLEKVWRWGGRVTMSMEAFERAPQQAGTCLALTS